MVQLKTQENFSDYKKKLNQLKIELRDIKNIFKYEEKKNY